jgi:hypothetical protein
MSILLQSLAEANRGDFDSFAYEFDFLVALESIWSPPSEAIPKVSESRSVESLDDVVSFSLDLPEPTP